MTISTVLSLLRISGALIGCVGGMAFVGSILLFFLGLRDGLFVILLAGMLLALGSYGLYVNSLTWRGRWPQAAHHLCGMAVYGSLLGIIVSLGTVLQHPVEPPPIWAFGFLGALLLFRFLHRAASQRLILFLFPPTDRPKDKT